MAFFLGFPIAPLRLETKLQAGPIFRYQVITVKLSAESRKVSLRDPAYNVRGPKLVL